jgi:hypothetical protein
LKTRFLDISVLKVEIKSGFNVERHSFWNLDFVLPFQIPKSKFQNNLN